MEERALFTELQRFNQWWIWVILLGVDVMMIVIFRQVVLEKTPGNDVVGNTALYFSVGILLMVNVLFLFLKLETNITKEGITVQLFPLHMNTKQYKWEEIDQALVRTYSPLGEYGGWGLRIGSSGTAYNVSGDRGIQLVFKNGEKLLIGTKKPKEAAQVLAAFKE